MLDIGLCMTVKDEAANIVDCLAPIAEMFAQIVVIDTGSTDGTRDILRDELGIEPECRHLDEGLCFALAQVRNEGFARLSTPWLMTLDADERLDTEELRATVALADGDLPAGLFCGWDTDYGDGVLVEDYKLNLFRSHHRHRGLIHDTAQPSLRAAGETADWLPGMRLRHFPDESRQSTKQARYAWRLQCATGREPHWLRYQWFAGYMAYRGGRTDEACRQFRAIHDARPALFPVESLNAAMMLATIHARQGDGLAVETVLEEALDHYRAVAGDFEVRVNFRLGPWLMAAREAAARGALDEIIPYAFPY